ncbi:MAG: retropepsin-like aspartic protease [Ignavibacteria bacterium]
MKIIFTLLLSFISAITFGQDKDIPQTLNKLYNGKQFFKLRSELDKEISMIDEIQKEYFQSLVFSIFNRPAESNTLIDKLLNNNKGSLTDSMIVELYKSKLVNSVNLFLYDDALKTTEIILSQYKYLIEKEHFEDFENTNQIWKASAGLSPQTVTITGDTKLTVKKDMAGLTNVKVSINGNEEEFVFDTGANFSTITNTFAKKLGLKFLKGSLDVGTTTDMKVKSDLAYADSLSIGKMNFRNVLFLVFPDEALSFGNGVYVINGVIGFPVIKEMKEISLSENEIFIPLIRDKSSNRNLALDGFLPLIETIVNDDTLVFSFDTGAKATMMYQPYYEANKSDIESKYEIGDIRIGGAGGEVTLKGFKLNDMNFKIGSGNAVLNDVVLLSTQIKDDDEYLYGNLGGDFINKFKKMIIDFEDMFVEFE